MKKQTALRLAQEQPPSSVLDHTDHGLSTDESTYLTSSATETPPPSEVEITEDVEVVIETAAVTFTTPTETETPPPSSTSGHRLFRSSSSHVKQQQRSAVEHLPAVSEKKYMTPPKSSGFFFRSQPSSAPTNPMKHHHQQHAPVSRSLFFTSNSAMGRNPSKNTQKNASVVNHVVAAGVSSDVIASHTAIDTSTATEKGANAKLPHGLTVQELKQMTKARLQAEASSSSHNSDGNMTNHTGPSATPPSRRSPYPMIYDNSSETWDTASASTTCTSEFLFPATGSAEVSMIVPPNSMEQDASILFERTLSYPNSSPHPQQQQQHAGSLVNNNSRVYGMFHHSSYANDVVGPTPFNRSRAATSSPRLGISSTADTSYPYHPSYPTIHNNNSSSIMPVDETLPFQNEYGYYPRSVANNYNNTMIDTNGNTTYESNRIRTSSLPSVLLPTTIENDVDHASQFNLRGINLTALMDPTPQVDDNNRSNIFVAGLSDTFQSPSSFPTFYSGTSEPARYRASTWTDAASHTSIDHNGATGIVPTSPLLLFGNVGGKPADSMTADVSYDLASILKLSTTTTTSLSPEPQPMGHNHPRRGSTATNSTTTDGVSSTFF